MKHRNSVKKRVVALMLAFVMTMSITLESWAVQDTVLEPGTYTSVTAGEIVAGCYADQLSGAEAALLSSGYMAGGLYRYTAPADGDKLLLVDEDQKLIYAESFEDEYGNRWVPAAARLLHDGSREDVVLTDGFGGMSGTFQYAGNDYTVEVDYRLTVTVPTDVQRTLLATAYDLAQGCGNMVTLYDQYTGLKALNDNLDTLYSLVSSGYLSEDDTAYKGITDLRRQKEKNASGSIDILDMLDAYNAAPAKVQYLLEHGAELRDTAKSTYDDVNGIYLSCINGEIRSAANMLQRLEGTGLVPAELVGVYQKVEVLKNTLKTILTALEPVVKDEWAALEENGLRAGLTDEEHLALDPLVEAAMPAGKNSTRHDELVPEETVRTVTATLTQSVNRYNVTVVVRADVIPTDSVNSDETALQTCTAGQFPLRSGAARGEVAAAAESLVELAKQEWTAFGVDEKNYTCTTRLLIGGTDSDTLAADAIFEVTYTPRQYTYTIMDGTAAVDTSTVPYGYRLLLPACPEKGQSYTYTEQNGTAYMEESIFTVTGDATLLRTQDKTLVPYTLGQRVAVGTGDRLTAAEKGVLTGAGLTINAEPLYIRVPAGEDELVTANGKTVNAKDYNAGEGLVWKPLTVESDRGEKAVFSGGTAVLTDDSYESVDVTYQLTFADAALDVQNVMELPQTLKKDAEAHKAAMAQLAGIDLSAANRKVLELARSSFADSLNQTSLKAIDYVLDNCFDEAGSLLLSKYIAQYAGESGAPSGLAYFYKDEQFRAIKSQVTMLSANLAVVAADPGFRELAAGKAQQIDALQKTMDGILDVLPDSVNRNIDTQASAEALEELCANVEKVTVTGGGHTWSGALCIEESFTVAAADKVVVTVEVTAGGFSRSGKLIFAMGQTLEAGDIAKLTALRDQLWSQLQGEPDAAAAGVSDKHYEAPAGVELKVGDTLTKSCRQVCACTPLTYTVNVQEEDGTAAYTAEFAFDAPKIMLNAHETSGIRYDYVIDGVVIKVSSSQSYTFTVEQIDRLFGDARTLTVSRSEVDVVSGSLLELFGEMEKIAAGSPLGFKTEADEKGTIKGVSVLVDISRGKLSSDVIGQLATYLVTKSDIVRVALNGRTFYDSQAKDGAFSMAALVTAVLESDFGVQALIEALNSAAISTADGAPVMKLDCTIANNAGSRQLTLTAAIRDGGTAVGAERAKTARDSLESWSQYGLFSCEDGTLKLWVNAPDALWQNVVTGLLMTGGVSVAEIDALTAGEVAAYAPQVRAIVNDPAFSMATVGNTITRYSGKTEDFTGAQRTSEFALRMARLLLDEEQVTWSGKAVSGAKGEVYSADGCLLSGRSLLTVLGLESKWQALFKEEAITVPISLTIENVCTDYEALVLSGSGQQIAAYYTDAAKAAQSCGENSRMILLRDAAADLRFTERATLDLNGKTLVGSITASGKLTVVDSTMNTAASGTVTGALAGDISLTAGHYGDASGARDVTQFLAPGYQQVARLVRSRFYVVRSTNGVDATVVVEPAALLEDIPTAEMLRDELTARLLARNFRAAAVTVEYENTDHPLYEMADIPDVAALAQQDNGAELLLDGLTIRTAGIESFANELVKAMTDLRGLADKLSSSTGVLARLTASARGWDAELRRDADNDCLTGALKVLSDSEKRSVTVTMGGQAEERAGLAQVLRQAAEVLTVNAALRDTRADILPSGKHIYSYTTADVAIRLDLTVRSGYTIIAAAVLHNSCTDGLRQKAYETAIQKALTGSIESLQAVLEEVTTEELLAAARAAVGKDMTAILTAAGIDAEAQEALTGLSGGASAVIRMAVAAADRLALAGSDTTLGSCAVADTFGAYTAERQTQQVQERSAAGVTNFATLTANADVFMRLFSRDITAVDSSGSKRYTGGSLQEAIDAAGDNGTVTVAAGVTMTGDVTVRTKIRIANAENIRQEGFKFLLAEGGQITADRELVADSAVAGYDAVWSRDGEQFVCSLSKAAVVVTDKNGVVSKFADLKAALEAAPEGSTVAVNQAVTLEQNAEVSRSITLTGVRNITFKAKILLSSPALGITLTADGDIGSYVTTQQKRAEVTSAKQDGKFVYTLTVASYTVVFDKNDSGAVGTAYSQKIPYGKATALQNVAFYKTGYTFVGWYTTKDGTGKQYKNGEQVTNLAGTGETVTLYAKWRQNVYTVRFDKNSTRATGTMQDQTMVYDTSLALNPNLFKNSGSTFTEWNVQADGKGAWYKDKATVRNLTTTDGAVVTLYAQWKGQRAGSANAVMGDGGILPYAMIAGGSALLALALYVVIRRREEL